MFKYLCALSVLFSGYAISATNNDMGLYRDNSYNILALAGGYNCGVYPVPNDLSDSEKYNGAQIGTAQLEITPYAGDNSAMVNIIFDTGTVITSPKLQLISTGAEMTMYGSETSGTVFAYAIYDSMGVKVVLQNKNKGKEISVGLANCKYDKK